MPSFAGARADVDVGPDVLFSRHKDMSFSASHLYPPLPSHDSVPSAMLCQAFLSSLLPCVPEPVTSDGATDGAGTNGASKKSSQLMLQAIRLHRALAVRCSLLLLLPAMMLKSCFLSPSFLSDAASDAAACGCRLRDVLSLSFEEEDDRKTERRTFSRYE